ncbi:MarR family winged helix-turn-helix transcriptional regulator [Bifidobacterium pullorum]|uniref:MarR family transcriptional regulator n=1 Tax=Bifidobacterium pullorum subsp. gallinarum TaxID=78344 RepID=A0A921IXB1_9BIFI|nr:helix-turn-helix domain-containing protein [Bifidobacterium pullorum]HJG41141.1 MarR family transcriptional regulator [Bifidobacterium pullorum subsp. gallinarum]
MDDNASLLLERFNRSWKEIDRVYHEIARRSGLSDCAFWILYALKDARAPMLQNDLSQVWLYSRQTVSSTLRQLEERELVDVRYASGSRRDKEIALTEQGVRFTDTYIEPAMAAEKQALTALGPDDSDTLPRVINRYAALLNQAVDDRCVSLPPAERHA